MLISPTISPLWVQLSAWQAIRKWPHMRAEALFRIEANIRERWILQDSGRC